MSINIRQKGQEGEREIQRALEPIIRKVMTEGGFPLPDKAIVQRNQISEYIVSEMADTLTKQEKALRQRFVAEYLADYDSVGAAIRLLVNQQVVNG